MAIVTSSETGAEPTARIRVLGPVEVVTNGQSAHLGGPKQRAVLAMLVARLERVVTTDELVDGIWGDDPPRAVLSSLHTYVSNLRTSVGHRIERHGSGYRLEVDRSHIDGYVFEDDVEAARKELVANPRAASDGLRQALALWRGRAYADVAILPGLFNESVRLEELRMSAVESRIEADLALGRHGALIGELEALAADFPLRESLRAKHMLALYRDGRQADALRAFRRTQEYLRDELGIDPSLELQELEERILNHDYTLIHSREVVNEEISLLFTDIVNSTLLWETHPAEMQLALAHHDDIMQSAIEGAGGTVVKSLGDGFIAAFPEPSSTVRAAVSTQRTILARNWSPLELTVRMAVDTGEVERRGGDLFGPPMNRGSRLLAAAHGGQILLSVEAQRHLGKDPGTQVKSLGEHRFKGLGAAQEVYQLVVDGLRVDFPPPATSPGTLELDRTFGDVICGYELRERVGRGAFATVYRAYQPSIGREVAIKIVKPEFANHPAFVRRFESEARFVASLEHPHIVSVYDYWRDAEGAYVVAPFLAGRSLADETFATLHRDKVLKIATQVGSALSYAHRHGVLHRDIKPANILIDGDGNAYLADFGVAARAVEAATGVVSASAGYRAPEDRDGAPVDARSDIYSLAAVVTRLLTGVEPGSFDLIGLEPGLRTALERALAPDPDHRPETVDEFLDMLTSSTGVSTPARTITSFRNPYKGLAAFQEPDAPDFFGRNDAIQRAVAMVAEDRLSAVVGPSGSGKSSLVLAGVLPAMRQGAAAASHNWVSVRSVPGGHPFDELATALGALSTESLSDLAIDLAASDAKGLLRVAKRISRELDADLVVVIDQFEELFTLVASHETRELFVASLANAAADPVGRTRIVLTLRADFFHEALSFPTLGPIISTAHLALAPLDVDATYEAIVEPAERAGLELEPGLADRIIADLADQPGSLPLLQFTLDRLAAATSDGRITHTAYDALGGVRGAIAERAEAAYRVLSPGQQEVARHIFTRLLTVSEEADDLRRRVRVSEFRSLGLHEADVEAVLDTFGKERLLTFDIDPATRGATVEVAHEALLREWPTLLAWVEARRESLLLQRRFQAAHAEWEESGRYPADLLTAGKLSQYEEWASGEEVRLTEAEREFFYASHAQRAAEAVDRRRRRRRILAGFAGAAVVASLLAGVAVWQRGLAQAEARQETVRQLAASSTAVLDEDPELATLLALEAAEVSRRTGEPVRHEAIAAIHEAVHASRVDRRFDGYVAAGFGRDGDVVTAELLHPIEADLAAPEAAMSPDGRFVAERVVAESEIPTAEIEVWDAATREEITRLVPTNSSGEGMFIHLGLVWSPDGTRMAAVIEDLNAGGAPRSWSVWVWTLSGDGKPLIIPENEESPGWPVFVDSTTLAVPDPVNERVVFYDVISGEEVDFLDTPGYRPSLGSFDPLTNRLLLGGVGEADPVHAWNLATKQLSWSQVVGDGGWPMAHPAERVVAVTGFSGVIHLVDVVNGADRGTLLGHTGRVLRMQPSLQGPALISATLGEVLVWDLGRGDPRGVGSLTIDPYCCSPAMSPDGMEVAVTSAENELQRFDLSTGAAVGRPISGGEGAVVRLSPDWRLAGTSVDEQGVVMDLSSGSVVLETPPCTSPGAFSSDGTAVVIDAYSLCAPGVEDQVLDVQTGETLMTLGEEGETLGPAGSAGAAGAVFNPGGAFEAGRYLAAIRAARLDIYDMAEGSPVTSLNIRDEWEQLPDSLAFDPTGRYLAVGASEGNRAWVIDMVLVAKGTSAAEAVIFDRPVDLGGVPGLAMNQDGVLATSSFGSLRLWNIHTGEQIIKIPVETVEPPMAVFTPEGDHLMYVDQTASGNVLRRFPLDSDELIELAQSRVTRDLTTEECERYQLEC